MTEALPGLRRWFPLPLVGVAVLLVVLIFLTPNLASSSSPSAGSLPTVAELIVDHVTTSNVTHFYVHGLGTVRYTQINIRIATNFSWVPLPPLANLTFRNATNATYSLAIAYATTANPVAVNVTAIYRDSAGSCAQYASVYAFSIQSFTLYTRPLSPSGGQQVTPLDTLPLTLLLNSVPVGSC